MKLVITATNFDIRKKLAIRNRGTSKKIPMELVITAASLYISKKIAARNKGMNRQI